MSEKAVAKNQDTQVSIRDSIASAKGTFSKIFGEEAEKRFIRESGFAIMAIQKNPKLALCTPESFKRAIANVALTNLSLNPTLALAYLVPRHVKAEDGKKVWEVSLMPSYMGFIEVLRNAGTLSSISADVVFEGDEFSYEKGTSPHIKHVPVLNRQGNPKPIAAYAVAVLMDNTTQFELMDWNAIMKRKDKSEAKNSQYGPWNNWGEEMAKKTAIRYLYKLLPKSERVNEVVKLLDDADPVNLERSKPKLLD